MRFARDFFYSKTTWTSILTIIGALIAWYLNQITWQEASAAVFASLQVMWRRDTQAKIAENSVGISPNEEVRLRDNDGLTT